MTKTADRIIRLFSKGDFGEKFIKCAQEDLPFILGRLSLLEEFYSLNAPGVDERSRLLARQLGVAPMPRKGWFTRLKQALT